MYTSQALQQTKKQYGFTIVELLVVIVVIGILAAITIVSYNGIVDRANDVSVRNDLSNISKQMTLYILNGNEMPRGVTRDGNAEIALEKMKLRVAQKSYGGHYMDGSSPYNLLYCYTTADAPDDENWAFVASSPTKAVYKITGANSNVQEYPREKWSDTSGWGEICPEVLEVDEYYSGDGTWLYQNGNWNNWVLNK